MLKATATFFTTWTKELNILLVIKKFWGFFIAFIAFTHLQLMLQKSPINSVKVNTIQGVSRQHLGYGKKPCWLHTRLLVVLWLNLLLQYGLLRIVAEILKFPKCILQDYHIILPHHQHEEMKTLSFKKHNVRNSYCDVNGGVIQTTSLHSWRQLKLWQKRSCDICGEHNNFLCRKYYIETHI